VGVEKAFEKIPPRLKAETNIFSIINNHHHCCYDHLSITIVTTIITITIITITIGVERAFEKFSPRVKDEKATSPLGGVITSIRMKKKVRNKHTHIHTHSLSISLSGDDVHSREGRQQTPP
jgi:hypothetical protein